MEISTNYESPLIAQAPKDLTCQQPTVNINVDKPRKPAKVLKGYPAKQCCSLLIGNLALLGGASATFMIPLMLGRVIDAMNNLDRDLINKYCLWMLYIIAGSSECVWIRGTTFNSMSEKIAQQLRYDFFFHIINKDIQFFDEIRTGDILSRMTSDTTVI